MADACTSTLVLVHKNTLFLHPRLRGSTKHGVVGIAGIAHRARNDGQCQGQEQTEHGENYVQEARKSGKAASYPSAEFRLVSKLLLLAR